MRREFNLAVTLLWAARPIAAMAQSKAVPTVAIVGSFGPGVIETLNDGLQEFGFIDGKTVVVLGSPASCFARGGIEDVVRRYCEEYRRPSRRARSPGKLQKRQQAQFQSYV